MESGSYSYTGRVGFCGIFEHFSGFEFFLLPNRIHARPHAGKYRELTLLRLRGGRGFSLSLTLWLSRNALLINQNWKRKKTQMDNPRLLTRKKLFVLSVLVFVIDFVLISLLLSRQFYLVPPLTNTTPYFYLILVLAPAIFTITFYIRTQASISWRKWIFFTAAVSVLLCVFLIVTGPILYQYSKVDCQSATHSGLLVQYSCICQQETPEGQTHQAQVSCSLNGFTFSPLLQIRQQGKWQSIP
jgi:hypothetical protein